MYSFHLKTNIQRKNKYFKELPVKSVQFRTYHQDAWYRQKIYPWTNQSLNKSMCYDFLKYLYIPGNWNSEIYLIINFFLENGFYANL